MSPNDSPTTGRPKLAADQPAGSNGAAPAAGEDRNGTPSGVLSEAEFKIKNERRHALVDKLIDGTLTAVEEEELHGLEAEIDAYVRVHFSGPAEVLDRAEERARRLGYVP